MTRDDWDDSGLLWTTRDDKVLLLMTREYWDD